MNNVNSLFFGYWNPDYIVTSRCRLGLQSNPVGDSRDHKLINPGEKDVQVPSPNYLEGVDNEVDIGRDNVGWHTQTCVCVEHILLQKAPLFKAPKSKLNGKGGELAGAAAGIPAGFHSRAGHNNEMRKEQEDYQARATLQKGNTEGKTSF